MPAPSTSTRRARREAAAAEPAQGDGGRLRERGDARVEIGGHGERAPRRHDHVLGEAAVLVDAEQAPARAERVEALAALRARPAAPQRLDGDGRTDGEVRDAFADGVDDAGELVAGRHALRHEADVAEMEVAPADAARAHADAHLARARAPDAASSISRSAPPSSQTTARIAVIAPLSRHLPGNQRLAERGAGSVTGSEHSVPRHT